MAWPYSLRKTLLLGVLFTVGLGYTPTRLQNSMGFLFFHTPSLLWNTVKLPAPPPNSLKAAILNVTKDFDELAHLIQDFLRLSNVDPAAERQFRVFLADRAVRSHPQLENSLDWLLALYKFAFPFLLMSMIARLCGGGGAPEQRPLIRNPSLEKRRDVHLHRAHLRAPSSPGTPTIQTNENISTFESAKSGVQPSYGSSQHAMVR